MFFLCGTEQFYSVHWPSRLIIASHSVEDRAEGLAEHIICLLGVHTCVRKFFLPISLPLHVNNSPYHLPLKFGRVWGGARRICSGCWTLLLPKHAAIRKSASVSVNGVIGKSLHIPMLYCPSHKHLFCPCLVRARTKESSWYQRMKRQFDIIRSVHSSLYSILALLRDLDTPHWKKWVMCITSEMPSTL